MIITHEGLPGTGKTYDAIIKIISNLKKGRVVCTNIEGTDIPIHQEAIKFLSDLTGGRVCLDREQGFISGNLLCLEFMLHPVSALES